MPTRQFWIFRFGCWVALVTAAVHMVGYVAGPAAPINDTEREILRLSTAYQYALPGGAHRSLMDFMNGFSLTFATLVAGLGLLGLMVAKYGRGDAPLTVAVARVIAVCSAVLLVISLTKFFLVPTAFILLMTVCFALASVRPPATAVSRSV